MPAVGSRKPARARASGWALLGLTVLVAGADSAGDPSIPGVSAVAAAPAAAEARRVEREGIAVDLDIDPVAGGGPLREGDSVRFRFSVTDTTTGAPLPGLYPAAWMSPLADGEVSRPETCAEKIEEFAGGSLLAKPELDLNVYYVLALNNDATISVVDPLFSFGGTRLLAMIRLPTPGEDWVLSPDQSRLYVSLPISGRLAVVDTITWEVVEYFDVGPRPRRLAFQPDGAYLWVALEGVGRTGDASGVSVVDPESGRVKNRVPTGRGPHELAFSDDSRYAFVTNAAAGTLTVIDVRTLEKVKDLATGERPTSAAWSPLAHAVYVTHEGDGTIVAVDGRSHEIVQRIEADPGVGQIKVAPDGRLAFAVNPEADVVYVVDTAANRIVQIGDLMDGPDQIAFTDELAYIRHRGSETILMLMLDEIGQEGKAVNVVDFPGGQKPFGEGSRPSPADAIVQAPGAPAVLVANPADQVIYFYKEGMAAPMGGFKNYDREPRAVLVVDRSLRERSRPGVYETAAKLSRPGRYEVAFFLDTPRIVHCFQAEVIPDPELERRRLESRPAAIEPSFEATTVAVGEALPLRFRLSDPNTGEPVTGLRDVQVLVYTSGNWNQRQWAREIDPGTYEVSFTPPSAGSYAVSVECRSQRLLFHQSPAVVVQAVAPEPEAPGGEAAPDGSAEPERGGWDR